MKIKKLSKMCLCGKVVNFECDEWIWDEWLCGEWSVYGTLCGECEKKVVKEIEDENE
tara:strand:- start:317 stop:487 length:171 start_codon:yes stop_codon:yes gene_type:complete